MIYTMTAKEIKSFLKVASSWHAYSGIQIEQSGGQITLRFPDGSILDDDTELSVGINDYIPSVNDSYFPGDGQIQDFTTAEALIYYLENIQNTVNYPGCSRFFKFQ